MTGITFCDLLIYVKKIKEKNIWQGCTNNKTNIYEKSDLGYIILGSKLMYYEKVTGIT